jgi:iron(III) transport system ATP-binding protein
MLSIKTLRKTFIARDGTRVKAIDGISLDVPQGKILTLLGPSGCGKTTILRCVAGLERPDSGAIGIGDNVVYDSDTKVLVPANKRGIGMVFQSYAIWPHMTVFENVAFPLRVAKDQSFSEAEIDAKVNRALEMVRLGGFGSRAATHLSGGQQQRLALARGLVREPSLLLLDEPLSNLDAKLREQMRFELKRLQLELGVTTLYVTHDQAEALALSDEVAVLNAGRVIQQGPPNDIYHHPNCEFVADFIGSTNMLEGTVDMAPGSDGRGRVRTAHGSLACVFPRVLGANAAAEVIVRPEDIVLSADGGGENTFRGRIVNRIFLGELIDYEISVGNDMLRARARPEWDFSIGSDVSISLPPGKCIGLARPDAGSPEARAHQEAG